MKFRLISPSGAQEINVIGRRSMLIHSFLWSGLALLGLGFFSNGAEVLVLILFGAYAVFIGGAQVLQLVYPNELFPTEIRSAAVGMGASPTRLPRRLDLGGLLHRDEQDRRRKNGITLFFMLTAVALALWFKYSVSTGESMVFSSHAIVYLAMAASAMGFGYAAWNVGILHGNVTVLAGASHFIPVLSAALAAVLLRTPLSMSFWQGAGMVCAGSILCWLATRSRSRLPLPADRRQVRESRS